MKKTLRDELRAIVLRTASQAVVKAAPGRKSGATDERQSAEVAANVVELLKTMSLYRRLESDLKTAPDSHFEAMKADFENNLSPYLRKGLAEMAKRLPHARGGRPSSLTDDEKREVCRLVLRLIEQGKSERESLAEAAERYKQRVSDRTIVRTWAKRAALLSDNPPIGATGNDPPQSKTPKRRDAR